MSILPHTIIGAVAGSFFELPPVSLLSGVVSHFVLDFIPHYDPEFRGKKKKSANTKLFYTVVIAIDIGLSLLLLAFFWQYPPLFWGAVGGILVDVDNFLQYKFKAFPLQAKIGITMHSEGSRWHNKLHFRSHGINLFIGAVLQGVVCLLGLIYLYTQCQFGCQSPVL